MFSVDRAIKSCISYSHLKDFFAGDQLFEIVCYTCFGHETNMKTF